MAQFYLSSEELLENLELINYELHRLGLNGEMLIAGGAAMCLAYLARSATKDIDAIYEPKTIIYDIATKIAKQKDLPENWLNDGVKGFMNEMALENKVLFKCFSNLKIYTVLPEYLLAMKLMSSRMDSETDKKDILFLMEYLKISTIEKAVNLLETFFKTEHIMPKVLYVIEECIEEIQEQKL